MDRLVDPETVYKTVYLRIEKDESAKSKEAKGLGERARERRIR